MQLWFRKNVCGEWSLNSSCNKIEDADNLEKDISNCSSNSSGDCSVKNLSYRNEDVDILESEVRNASSGAIRNFSFKPPMFQKGVLRTNCIDCLDRTNVAQYAYGLVALGRQLHALGLIDVPQIDLHSTLADDLMKLYETMGDTLALQYGGSAAHNKVMLLLGNIYFLF